jgi:hypothetical protein
VEKINSMLRDLWAAFRETGLASSITKSSCANGRARAIAGQAEASGAKRITAVNNIPENLPPMDGGAAQIQPLSSSFCSRMKSSALRPAARCSSTPRSFPGRGRINRRSRLTVQDNGPGLPQEALRLIFDPFVVPLRQPARIRHQLMACYSSCHHGGRIEARNAPDAGTHLQTLTVSRGLQPASPSWTDERNFVQEVLVNET